MVKLILEIHYLTKEKDEEKDKEIPHKILFTGLDTAGKSTIILAIQREFSKIALLKPTRGAQRRIFEFLGHDVPAWELCFWLQVQKEKGMLCRTRVF